METGVIFDIKEFALYDGPGIRQTVFFKGCPLRCNWCHNPEGLSVAAELMASPSGCEQCGACKQVCTHDPCTACGACVQACPLRLRRLCGERMSAEQLIVRLKRDADYYESCGGGVTFSGGEPLMQPAFLLEVLDGLRGMHKLIETSGYAPAAVFKSACERLDHVIMDIKLADSDAHSRHTGKSNAPILENLRWLMGTEIPFTARVPLIPGVTDTRENCRAIAELLQGARALDCVELLPYHKTAGAKYPMVSTAYAPLFDPERPVEFHTDVFEEYGLRSCVL